MMVDPPAPVLSEAADLALEDLRQPTLAPAWIACAAVLIDLPVLAVAFWFAQFAIAPAETFSPLGATAAAALAAAVATACLIAFGGYGPDTLRRPVRSLVLLAGALVLPVGALCLLLPAGAAAVLPAVALSAGVAAVPVRLGGAAILTWMCRMRLLDRRAVIAGGGEHALDLIRGLRASSGSIRVVGLFDDRDDTRSPMQVVGVPKLGSYQDLIAFVQRSEIDMVIVALPLEAERRIAWLLDAFRVLPVEVRLSAFSRDYGFSATRHGSLIAAARHSFGPDCRLTKRLFDLAFASGALLLAAPVMLVAALAIRWESPGPILFRQKRHGYNNRVIDVLKFRSMYHDQADLLASRVVGRGDPRVTRVGRILRRTSIDELPQLFNVLRGDLSLVGPRPHVVDARSSQMQRFTQIVDGYCARHRLPPGITGWAQINGWRGEIDHPERLRGRFEHDLYYIENWSIWLDLKILLRTPLSLLDGRFAY